MKTRKIDAKTQKHAECVMGLSVLQMNINNTVECQNQNDRYPNNAEIRTDDHLNRSSSDFGCSVHSIVQISDIYPYITLKMPKSERSNEHVPISGKLVVRTKFGTKRLSPVRNPN